MDEIVYVIPGEPIPLARPRHSHNNVYDSQKNQKLVLSINLRNQHKNKPLYLGPLLLNITFYMPVAKSREEFKASLMGTPHFYKPDLSNLIKMTEDIANGIIFKDDCQIVEIIAKKIYGEPRTEFTITEMR